MIYFGDNKMPDFCNRGYPFHYVTALNLLTKMGIDINRVEMLAIGKYENYKGEILKQEPAPGSDLHENTRIVLEVGCFSAVDLLPYQFFYGLQANIRRSDDWELHGRHLMAPYDAAIIRHEATARYQTLKYNLSVIDEDYLRRFLGLFEFVPGGDGHDIADAIIWASLLPTFHQWGGNPERVANVLGFFFGFRFRIVENVRSEFEIPDAIRYRLGSKSGRLGRESILGRSFSEYDSTYQIIVSGIRREEIAAFTPGGAQRKKLDWVLSVCMPSNLDYRITFEIENKATVIGKQDCSAYLGYSTHLTEKRGTRELRR